MILIKAKDNFYNYDCVYKIAISENKEKILIIGATALVYELYENKNIEVVQKVYDMIQNQIIALNAKNESGCIDVEAIIKQVEEEHVYNA